MADEQHPPNRFEHELDRRLSKLEAVVESLATSVGRVTDDIGSLAGVLRSTGQTQWGTVFAGVTLAALLVTGYVGLPLSSLTDKVDTLVDDIMAHREYSYSTNAALERRIDVLEAEVAVQDERTKTIVEALEGASINYLPVK